MYLFKKYKGNSAKAFLAVYQDGRNVPPRWIENYRGTRKNVENSLAKALRKRKAKKADLNLLAKWDENYQKECFYKGIRILLELKRDGKTRR